MPKRISTTPPAFMVDQPKPNLESRKFHNLDVEVFSGEVWLNKIEGWSGNPRTELHFEQFVSQYGRPPTNDEMYEMVIEDADPREGLKVVELAGNIYKNGVRVPIVTTFDGKLLDGNRRFYACTFLYKNAKTKEEKKRVERIPAYVLTAETTSDVEDAIITEFNIASDFYVEWAYYTRANRVFRDYVENELTKEELESKYGQHWRILSKWINAAKLCQRFLDYHENTFLAKQFAYRNFIMFDEMMRNFGKRFDEAGFRDAVFDLLIADYDRNPRFKKSADVVRIDEIWSNAEAWEALTSGKGQQSLKDAIGILEDSNDPIPDPNKKLRSVVRGIEKLQNSGAMSVANTELLTKFHQLAEQAPGAPKDPDTRVNKMIEWLDLMTSRQIADLSSATVESLRTALERVLKMAEAIQSAPAKKRKQ
jgi:hypothetical protein